MYRLLTITGEVYDTDVLSPVVDIDTLDYKLGEVIKKYRDYEILNTTYNSGIIWTALVRVNDPTIRNS